MSTWVFCAGMLRSGSTLQYQIAADILESRQCGRRVPYFPEDAFADAFSAHKDDPGLLAYKTHVWTPEKAQVVLAGSGKVLYSFRDLRDVVVSASRKFGLSVEELLANGWIDRAVEDSQRWRELPGTLSSSYDRLVGDIAGESVRIADWLGITISPEFSAILSMRYSIENQRKRLPAPPRMSPAAGGREEAVFDPDSLLHHNHIDDGATDKWMYRLTIRQVLAIERRYGTWLVENGYPVS